MSNILQWRNAAALASFPFQEGAAPLLEDLLVDAQIMVPDGISGAFLKTLSVSTEEVIGVIHSTSGDKIGTFRSAIAEIEGASATILDDDGIGRGCVVFGGSKNRIVEEASLSRKTFKKNESVFETSCLIRTSPFRRMATMAVDGNILRGKTGLVEGDGIRLVKLAENRLRIDAVGSVRGREDCCQETVDPIRMINDATPSKYGDIQFGTHPFSEPESVSDLMQILRISSKENTIVFFLAK